MKAKNNRCISGRKYNKTFNFSNIRGLGLLRKAFTLSTLHPWNIYVYIYLFSKLL